MVHRLAPRALEEEVSGFIHDLNLETNFSKLISGVLSSAPELCGVNKVQEIS